MFLHACFYNTFSPRNAFRKFPQTSHVNNHKKSVDFTPVLFRHFMCYVSHVDFIHVFIFPQVIFSYGLFIFCIAAM